MRPRELAIGAQSVMTVILLGYLMAPALSVSDPSWENDK